MPTPPSPQPPAGLEERTSPYRHRWVARGFWVAAVVLTVTWVLLPARREQAYLLFRGWYPGMLRLLRAQSPEAERSQYRLDQMLLTRYWLVREGKAPHALEAAMEQLGGKARIRFDTVVKPLLARWQERRDRFGQQAHPGSASGWEAWLGPEPPPAEQAANHPIVEIHGQGMEPVGGPASREFRRRTPEAALVFVFPAPSNTARIGDGLEWRLHIPEGVRVPDAPWQVKWLTAPSGQFADDRVLLVAPRFDSATRLLILGVDMRAAPDWIANTPLLALHLALPAGDDPGRVVVKELRGLDLPAPSVGK